MARATVLVHNSHEDIDGVQYSIQIQTIIAGVDDNSSQGGIK